ncbi:MAG: transposase family protein [Nodosilinea sp.]
MHLLPQSPAVGLQPSLETQPERIEILDAFAGLPDVRKAFGRRHHMALCQALFTLAVTAGNQGFISIGDWLKCYQHDLIDLFNPPERRLPSYSTIRRVLLKLDYKQYSAA